MFIAQESGRQLNAALLPDQVATTVVTLAELNLGVTQDDDFDALNGVAGVDVIRV